MATKRKLSTKTYQEKYEIIKFCQANPTLKQKDIAEMFDLKPQTLSDYLKNKEKIFAALENPDARKGNIKRAKKCSFEDVDAALIIWFRQKSRALDTRLSGELMLQKANYFVGEFGHESTVSPGWIDRFKKRWGIAKAQKSGEAGGMGSSIVDDWKDVTLNDILNRYRPSDIYNASETGLFWQLLPDKSLSCSGKKQPKTRITLLVAANMDGSDKLPLYVIGRCNKPRAFKNIREIPVEYSANNNAWMTGALFENWLDKLDRRMAFEKRKVAMIVDNCSAHPHVELENVEIVFLPPNTANVTQPMDGGIIRDLKFHYRHAMTERRLEAAEKRTAFKWNILDAILAIKAAWSKVTAATIVDACRKVGFALQGTETPEDRKPFLTASTDIPESPAESFKNVWGRLVDIYGESTVPSLDKYVDIDANDTDTVQELTDAEIITLVREQETADVSDGETTGSDDTSPLPTVHDALKSLDTIRRFTMSMEDRSTVNYLLAIAQEFESAFMQEMPK